jgi:flagellar assembly factor FliW
VNVVTTRFGTIQVPEADLVRIADGLVGFRGHTQFVLWADPEVRGLTWLQSTSAPELAFALLPPPASAADYKVDLRPGDRASLELEDDRDLQVYVILNRGEGGGLTVNLQGPVVINKRRRIGRQMVLTSSRHSVRYPLELPEPDSAPTLLPATQAQAAALRASA